MAKNYVQPGMVMEYTNGTGTTISAGSVVVVGQTLAVALVDIAAGAKGSAQCCGVFTVPKVTTAVIKQGESLLWDVSAGKFDVKGATPATGDVTGPTAHAFEDAGNGVTSFMVKFTGCPGTVA